MSEPLTLLVSQPAVASQGESNDLLAAQARRDPDAFARLYQQHLPRVYRYHLAHTGDVQDAQDLTAQTFLTALERITTFRGQSTFLGWLFGIASHKAADYFRQRRAHLPLDEAEDLPHPAPLPEDRAAISLQMAQVTRALWSISPERAEAVVLRLMGGLSAAEAAQVMGKSEAAVKMLVHRGLQELQATFQPNEVDR